MENCVFCSIVKNNSPHHEIWYEDENHIAFLDIKPRQKGHTLVIPKKHESDVINLSENEYAELFKTVQKVSQKLKEQAKTNRIALIVDGYSVGHVHVHLIPTDKGEDLWEARNKNPDKGELERIGNELRNI